METLDGKILTEGERCWVSCQCPMGVHRLSLTPRRAVYLDEDAKENGWDFTLAVLKVDCEPEIIAVWKEKPIPSPT